MTTPDQRTRNLLQRVRSSRSWKPMIRSSANRFFMSNLLDGGLDSKPPCYSKPGNIGQ